MIIRSYNINGLNTRCEIHFLCWYNYITKFNFILIKVVGELNNYESFSRSTKDELKVCLAVKEKEMVKKRELEQIRQRNLRDHKKLSTLDSELKKSKLQVIRATKETENIIENFEREKFRNLKGILLDFIAIEIKHHARSIEVLTAAYQDLSEMDEENDNKAGSVKKNHSAVNDTDPKSGGYLSRFRSQSLVALNSLFHHGHPSGTESKRQNSALSHSTTSLNSMESPQFLRKGGRPRHEIDKKHALKDASDSSSTPGNSHEEREEDYEVDTQKTKINQSKQLNYKGRKHHVT